jgi:hypothetical protein
MYCYSNNGLSFHLVEEDYTAQPKEVLFSELATSEQLSAAFPNYTSAAQAQANLSTAVLALAVSDVTMHRIAEAVSLGLTAWTTADVVAWVDYRRALRIIINASGSGALPTKPAYPAGT